MDPRGWLWKKKSSDKSIIAVAHLEHQDNGKNNNYVQISMESYTHMCALEDQVKALEDKLSAAYSELNNKDNLVKQHATVAEEAVSGWEKADAQVASLRCQLKSVTVSKLVAEDRALHLDGALNECMKQIRTVKEDSEQKLQELILVKSQQWEKVKSEFEVKIDKLEQRLGRQASENAALLRSLQDSSDKTARLKDEKSEAEAEVELLKKNIQSYEKEIASLKYEVHVISKELDIRNEEKNMLMRSAQVASKKNAEDARNIANIETECQRLRGLLRRKLPGPAALAQMKLEVGSELEVLEEETKRLKEALATSNAELQASRNLYTKTVCRLKTLEAEIQFFHLEKGAEKTNLAINFDNPASITCISDDGHEEPESPIESSAASTSDLSEIKRVTSVGKFKKEKSEAIMELMNDFLEVEKMACSSDINSNVTLGITSKVNDSNGTDKQSDEPPKVEKEQLLAELKEQLASSHKSYSLAEIQLKCMTESYQSLKRHAEYLEAENKILQEKIEELKNDLVEQKRCHDDALVRHREIEEKMQRDKCLVCGSNSNLAADKCMTTEKGMELAAAEQKLAECQETLYTLGRQLQALCPQIEMPVSHLGKRLQMNDMLLASDTEGSFSLNSSIGSSQPGYMLTELSSSCSASSIEGKNAH